jgi:serine/threonine-protein kinase
MSPDQLSGEEVDARSDIYSLGVVFFEMLIGQRPFNEKDILKVIVQHQKALPPRPSSLNGEIPPGLDLIILRMLAKDPNDRHQSVETLLVDLKDYMLGAGIEAI